jgi:TonB family protein
MRGPLPLSMFRRGSRLALVVLLPWLSQAAGASNQPDKGAGAPAELETQLGAAQALLDQRQIEAAAAAFQQANDAAGGRCGRCLLGLAQAQQLLGKLETAIATTREAVAALAGDPLQGRAYCQLGDRLLAGEVTPAAAAEAEAAYGKALDAGAAYRAEALSGIAEARLRVDRYQQAIEAAQESLAVSRNGNFAGRARSIICRARLGGDLPSRAFLVPEGPHAGAPGSRMFAVPEKPAPVFPDMDEEVPLRVGGAVSRPEKFYAPPPVYTEEARKMRLQGVVIIEAVIDKEGCVRRNQILKGMPLGLSRAALAAVEKWVFEPAALDGKPVKVYYTLTINFQVQ